MNPMMIMTGLRRPTRPAVLILVLVLTSTSIASVNATSPINFGTVMDLSDNKGNSSFVDQHAIAVSGSSVYVTWQGRANDTTQVFLAVSSDHGTSFSRAKNLSPTSGPTSLQKVASSRSGVYVVWRDNVTGTGLIYVRASHDRGATFDPAIVLSQHTSL